MSVVALGTALSPVTSTAASNLPVSTTLIVIVLVVAVLGGFAILGWRAPDRSPKADEKVKRQEEE
jgi:hypothetical protein